MRFVLTVFLLVIGYNSIAQTLIDYYELGEYSKAIESFKNIDTPSAEDQLILAKVYCAKGMTLDCMDTYQKALSNAESGSLLKSKFQYAKILQTQRKYKEADSLYSNLLKIMPEHAEILYQKGKIADKLGKMAYHQYFLEALLYDPKHIKAAHDASRYFMDVDNLKMAKTICLKSLDLVPQTPRLLNLLAQIHYRQEEWQTSLSYIKALEDLKPDLPKFIYDIKGNIYLKLGQQQEALNAFKIAFQKDSKDYQICLKIAELYIYLDDPLKAGRYLSLYNRMRDTSMWEYNFLSGKMFMQQKKYMTAFYQFEKAYRENSNHEASLYYRAVAADNFMEDKSKALDYYTNYIETFEDEKDTRFIEVALRRETEIRRELFMKE